MNLTSEILASTYKPGIWPCSILFNYLYMLHYVSDHKEVRASCI